MLSKRPVLNITVALLRDEQSACMTQASSCSLTPQHRLQQFLIVAALPPAAYIQELIHTTLHFLNPFASIINQIIHAQMITKSDKAGSTNEAAFFAAAKYTSMKMHIPRLPPRVNFFGPSLFYFTVHRETLLHLPYQSFVAFRQAHVSRRLSRNKKRITHQVHYITDRTKFSHHLKARREQSIAN